MDIFTKLSQLTGSAEGVMKGLAIILGILAALKIIDWGKSVTFARVALAVVVAGGVVLVVQNPDLLTGDFKETFSLPAPQQMQPSQISATTATPTAATGLGVSPGAGWDAAAEVVPSL